MGEKKKMTRLGKIGNKILDAGKGVFQVLAIFGGPGGVLAGGAYGIVNGFQTCRNGNISFSESPMKFSSVMASSMAMGMFTSSIPLAGPLLMGMTGSMIEQGVTSFLGKDATRKLSWKEVLISAVPFAGPIISGMYRDSAMEYVKKDVSSEKRDTTVKREPRDGGSQKGMSAAPRAVIPRPVKKDGKSSHVDRYERKKDEAGKDVLEI